MAFKVILPKIGLSEESSIIGEWYKKKGDFVKKGELLFSVETDKSTSEIEAEEEGTILEIFYQEGDEAPVLSTVCIIGEADEDISDLLSQDEGDKQRDENISTEVSKPTMQPEKNRESTSLQETLLDFNEGKLKISPRAKNLAEQAKVDYRMANATGPYGRIIEKDIVSLKNQRSFTSAAHYENGLLDEHNPITEGTGIGGRITLEDLKGSTEEGRNEELLKEDLNKQPVVSGTEKLKSMRKTIAVNMMHSLHNTAQLTLNSSFDASDILAYRKKLKDVGNELSLEKISINDIILYAVSRTLNEYPYLNAHLVDDEIRFFEHVHLGVAVDTPRGLMVPTVFYSDLRSLNDIAIQVKSLAQKCNEGSILPDELKNGSFTITNLGNLDIETFTPVLNPPQTGILGVGSLNYKMKEVDGDFVPYPAIGLSLTFDHRALDGAPAARFLKELKSNLENFTVLLAK